MHLLKFLYSIPTCTFPQNEHKWDLGICFKKRVVPIHIYDALVARVLSLLKNKSYLPNIKNRKGLIARKSELQLSKQKHFK